MSWLFLGNSYTFVHELDLVVAQVFEEAGAGRPEVQRLAFPGWTLADHAAEAALEGSAHDQALSLPQDWVVLQDQSQIPGFPEGDPALEASREAAVALDARAAGTGGGTLFLMTWGRRDGDADNPGIYPDFPTMQAALAGGYQGYVDLASADGSPAWLAPAGLAWARVWQDEVDAGRDPLAPDSPFVALYDADGSHPALPGTWLTAWVVYASVTGDSPEGLPLPEGVGDGAYLQGVAAAVVLEGEGVDYPWSGAGDGGADSGGPDSGGPDSGVPDADGDGGGEGSLVGVAGDEGGGACGCLAGPGPGGGAAFVGLLLVLGWRRERR